MSDKPSLYVVEKREVVILVVLFVLVTVLSFTLGVRYGETVGRKKAREQQAAELEHGNESAEAIGGTLGKGGEPAEAGGGHGEKDTPKSGHGEAAEAEGHGHAAAEAHGEKPAKAEHEAKPEAAAKSGGRSGGRETVDKNSDEYLLSALKEAGVEPPGGKSPSEAKLPQDVKKVQSGAYVIQVGSHPTRNEAEAQVRQLKGRRVQAEILPPFKDRQGEWHRVVIGNFKSKRDAEKEATGMKSRGTILSYFVWRLP